MSRTTPALGPCCICGEGRKVRTIISLNVRAPVAGHGWGCVQCGVPADGAVAVLCDDCCDAYKAGAKLILACRGYPGTEGRIPIDELVEPFGHDLSKHPELGGHDET